MTSLDDIFPPLGVRVSAGPVALVPLTDDVIPAVVELALGGVHDPATMPFTHPWTDAPADELPANSARFYWSERASFTRERWSLNFAVTHNGELVGCQGMATEHYLVTRTAETGSWLARRHHRRGIGTLMRQTICAFAFDYLDAAELTSGAYTDNAASLGVSRAVGYRPNGTDRFERRGQLAEHQRLLLTPAALIRHEYPLQVDGLDAFRRFIGLDA